MHTASASARRTLKTGNLNLIRTTAAQLSRVDLAERGYGEAEAHGNTCVPMGDTSGWPTTNTTDTTRFDDWSTRPIRVVLRSQRVGLVQFDA